MTLQTIKRSMKEKILSLHRPAARLRRNPGAGLPLVICLLSALMINTVQAQIPDYDALDEILARNVRNGFVDYDGRVLSDANGYPIPSGAFGWETMPRQEDGNDSTDWFVRRST